MMVTCNLCLGLKEAQTVLWCEDVVLCVLYLSLVQECLILKFFYNFICKEIYVAVNKLILV